MAASKLIVPIEIQQLAQQQQRIVDQNNAKKIFDYEERVRQAKDYTDKGLPIPAGYEPTPPILTRFDADKYATLYMQDDAAWRELDGEGKAGEQTVANLDEAFTPYTYEPPAAPAVAAPTQPKNPLGVMLDEDMGIFARAIGDKLPVNSKFSMMGTDYVLTPFGGQIGGKRLFWVRQG
jgi:hypothetical protein